MFVLMTIILREKYIYIEEKKVLKSSQAQKVGHAISCLKKESMEGHVTISVS